MDFRKLLLLIDIIKIAGRMEGYLSIKSLIFINRYDDIIINCINLN